ncbi:transcription factor WER-like [Senna tora]|uniref:Transcription factor WER-like n=1 Tax=Senna tora TaxID=362788 RepID=A0A834T2D8_9FABA|nr:transcription factor WER-like [Senna tora]
MGRRRSCKNEINKGTWTKEEDEILFTYVTLHGERKWREVAQFSGLKRCAKSCRYRYLNYLKPGLKRGDISEDEQDLIIELQHQLEEDDEDDNNIDDFLLIDQIGNNNNNNVNDDKKKVEDDEKLINRHGLKGAWSKKEDEILSNYVALHGEGQWNKVAQRTGRTDSEIKNHWHAYLSKKLDDEDAKSSLNKDYDHQKSEDNHIDEEQMKYVFTPQVDDLPAKRSNLEDNNNINNVWEFSEFDFDLNYTTDPTTNNSSLFEIEYDTAFLDSYLFNFFQNDQMNADVHHHELISKTPKFDEDHKDVFASSFNIVHGHCEAEEADIMDFWTSSDEFRFTDW